MKPTILISGTIAEATSAMVKVLPGVSGEVNATVFANGLAGAESVAIAILSSAVDPADAVAGDWLAVSDAGTAVVLDVDTPVRTLQGPGVYKLTIESSAGAVKIGVYQ